MRPYVGRFAPSPTGPLHFGSIVAAVGSYLQARSSGGRWLLRIEDIDPAREVRGAADAIPRELARLGFQWDGDVVLQSTRSTHYDAALSALAARNLIYACSCSRKDTLATTPEGSSVYPGTCRSGMRRAGAATALRIRTPARVIAIDDRLQGRFAQQLERDVGDFVLRRRDGL
jgi:glutamyl-Q tRNA(Asp) synthetase